MCLFAASGAMDDVTRIIWLLCFGRQEDRAWLSVLVGKMAHPGCIVFSPILCTLVAVAVTLVS